MENRLKSFLRGALPKDAKSGLKVLARGCLPVRHRSRFTNIYHCSWIRSGTLWLRGILNDLRVYRWSGLKPCNFDRYGRQLSRRVDMSRYPHVTFDAPLPAGTIVTPTHLAAEACRSIPKPDAYRVLLAVRDPRDMVVSSYFRTRHRQTLTTPPGPLPGLPLAEGLMEEIDRLAEEGWFRWAEEWLDQSRRDPAVLLLRFEDLVSPEARQTFEKLFSDCDIAMPPGVLAGLLEDWRFERVSGGRSPGEEDASSHHRKGISGEWKNHFDQAVAGRFEERAGDLPACLGYSD